MPSPVSDDAAYASDARHKGGRGAHVQPLHANDVTTNEDAAEARAFEEWLERVTYM
jgi:hypothetical protein